MKWGTLIRVMAAEKHAEKPQPGWAPEWPPPAVAVVGGGPAGLAAAALGAKHGLRVALYEQRARLGGRADSFIDPASGRLIDYGQHVGLGCCRALADFCRLTGVDDCFEAFAEIHLVAPDGRRYDLKPSRFLPAPLHLLPSLLRLGYLPFSQRLAILRAAWRLPRLTPTMTILDGAATSQTARAPSQSAGRAPGAPLAAQDAAQTIDRWLQAQGQSRRAIDEFWSLVLVSALSETLEHIAFAEAANVLRAGLFDSRFGHALLVPRVPMAEIFDQRVGRWLAQHGVELRRRTPVKRVAWSGAGSPSSVRLVLGDGTVRKFDFAVIAVPPRQLASLLPHELRAEHGWLEQLAALPEGGITVVHLWFDRPIIDLPQAALVGRIAQWVFAPAGFRGPAAGARSSSSHPSGPQPSSPRGQDTPAEWYCKAVVSASHRLLSRDPRQTVHRVLDDLRAVLPAAREAVLRRARVINRPTAVLALHPGVAARRAPAVALGGPVVLAGAWTATGWPATMESAVRSACLAMEAVLQMCGRPARLLAPAARAYWPQLGE